MFLLERIGVLNSGSIRSAVHSSVLPWRLSRVSNLAKPLHEKSLFGGGFSFTFKCGITIADMREETAEFYAVTRSVNADTTGLYSVRIFTDGTAEIMKLNSIGPTRSPVGTTSTGGGVYLDHNVNVGGLRSSKIVALFLDPDDACMCFHSPQLLPQDPRWIHQSRELVVELSRVIGFRFDKSIW